MNQQTRLFLSLIVLVAVSMWVGFSISYLPFFGPSSKVERNTRKIGELLRLIDENYVDAVDIDSLSQDAIMAFLERLDPHSSYSPPSEAKLETAYIKGGFDGIGISFYLFDDTVVVENTLPGGSAERKGLRPGDRLVEVDGKNFVHKDSREVMEALRGQKGSTVAIKVVRPGLSQPLSWELERGPIATSAVEVAFMPIPKVGYIRLSRFSSDSHREVRRSIASLKSQGMETLIFDLQGNGGGLLDQAINIADEFLAGQPLIVYTQGKNPSSDSEFYARNTGTFEQGTLLVLIDEGSASASEIVAGALQDNDRATLIGRRTFGKGLVQRPVMMEDGSMLKITVSRYYTPSGRSIQKPYTSRKEYSHELLSRYESGEYFSQDSVKYDSANSFRTKNGRRVFGGGGISPDVFVPKDTSNFTPWIARILQKSVVRETAVRLSQTIPASTDLETFVNNYKLSERDWQVFWQVARQVEIQPPTEINSYLSFIEHQIKSQIARLIWGDEGFYRIYLQKDEIFQKALQWAGR